ncbi:MAG: protein translocase subunit SecF [Thermodesulfobacteriota bacterium]
MEFIKSTPKIDFVGMRKKAYVVSAILLLASIAAVILIGPRFGVDFVGGTLIQIKFSAPTKTSVIKQGLKSIGLDGAAVQKFGESDASEFLIRTNQPVDASEEFTGQLEKTLGESTGQTAAIQRIEMVGPQVGKDLREKALLAIYYTMLMITIYISGRFELKWTLSIIVAGVLIGAVYLFSLFHVGLVFLIATALIVTLVLFWFLSLKYAMGAIVALLHDVLITVGIFCIMGKEFTLPIIAALLTIIGYSLNDTIIVYDRIRENLRKNSKNTLDVNINLSVNETLSRTILTGGTTLVSVVALLIWGGGIIHDFAFAMTVGILVGTYSSVFVASPILLAYQGRR